MNLETATETSFLAYLGLYLGTVISNFAYSCGKERKEKESRMIDHPETGSAGRIDYLRLFYESLNPLTLYE